MQACDRDLQAPWIGATPWDEEPDEAPAGVCGMCGEPVYASAGYYDTGDGLICEALDCRSEYMELFYVHPF